MKNRTGCTGGVMRRTCAKSEHTGPFRQGRFIKTESPDKKKRGHYAGDDTNAPRFIKRD
jgi:hypothetical protein